MIRNLRKSTLARFRGPIWHKQKWQSYAWANSFYGRLHALKKGLHARDVDLRFSADEIGLATHEGLVVNEFNGGNPRHMTWRKVTKMRSRRGGYGIRSACRTLVMDRRNGMEPYFEIKPDARLLTAAKCVRMFAPLVKAARRTGGPLNLMMQPHHDAALVVFRWLKAAYGDDVRLTLQTRGQVPDAYWPVIDAAKGPRRHMRGKPARVKVLGGRVA
jgi:hypothetical protein